MARRPGLFGGFNPLRFTGEPNEKLMLASAALSSAGNGGDPSALIGVGNLFAKRRQDEARQQALAELGGFLGGGQAAPMPQPQTIDLGALAQGNLGPTDTQAMAAQPRGMPNLSAAAPALLRAQQAGIDIGPYVNLLDKVRPDIQVDTGSGETFDARDPASLNRRFARPTVVNGLIVDQANPNNLERFIPQVGEGQELLRDAQGNPVIRNIEGYASALGQRERTVSDARNASQASYAGVTAENTAAGQGRGSAPYDLVTVQGPNGPVSISREAALGLGYIQGTDTSTINARETRNEEALGQINGLRENIGKFGSVLNSLGFDATGKALQNVQPEFNLNPMSIARYELDLRLGRDNPEAAAYANYRSTIQEIVNQELRLNTGPQTDQDAIREAQGILSNINNRAYVAERLPRLIASGERRIKALQEGVQRRQGGGQQAAPSQGGADRAARAREILRQRGRL